MYNNLNFVHYFFTALMINCCVRTGEQSFDIYHENRFRNNKQIKVYKARVIICCIIKLIRLSTVWGTRFIIVEQELLTLPDHPVFSGGHIGFCVQLHVFMFLVPERISRSCSPRDTRRITVKPHDHNQIWKSRWTQVCVNKYKLNIT
jgi:hypothetical protein